MIQSTAPARTRTILTRHARWLQARGPRTRPLPALFFLTDSARTPNPLDVLPHLPPGTGVIFRHYETPGRCALARTCAACCRAHRLVFLVAGNGRLAAHLRADGLHLPARLCEKARTWRRTRPGWLITAAAHSFADLRKAADCGVDAAFLSPVFATQSHPRARPLGAVRLAALCHGARLPVYALGGISAANIAALHGAGVKGIGAIGAFLD